MFILYVSFLNTVFYRRLSGSFFHFYSRPQKFGGLVLIQWPAAVFGLLPQGRSSVYDLSPPHAALMKQHGR